MFADASHNREMTASIYEIKIVHDDNRTRLDGSTKIIEICVATGLNPEASFAEHSGHLRMRSTILSGRTSTSGNHFLRFLNSKRRQNHLEHCRTTIP